MADEPNIDEPMLNADDLHRLADRVGQRHQPPPAAVYREAADALNTAVAERDAAVAERDRLRERVDVLETTICRYLDDQIDEADLVEVIVDDD